MRVFLLLFFLTLTGCQSDQTQEKPSQSQTASTEQTDQQPQPPVSETSERDESVESNKQDDPAPQAASEEPAVEEEAVASETQNVGEEPITAEGNSPAGTAGSDWATFLGPGGNSKSAETGALTKWPEGGLRIVWQKPLGTSYGIGSVSKGRYYQFDRTKETVHLDCLDAKTGNRIWQFRYHSDYEDIFGYDGGPRSSPLVDENRIYLLGVEGLLQCLETETGKLIWKVDTAKEFGVVQNFFGAGSTPVIEGDLVIAMVGGSPEESQTLAPGDLEQVTGNGTGVVAFDKRT
ncbi:MAG: PQQ-binding-like beta-propeller repeat protein, partial [Pirellulaceae bacterium]